jgi:dihydropteroate synthase
MRDLIAASGKHCVVMHHLSIPASKQHILPANEDPVAVVYQWAERRLHELMAANIVLDKIIFDPGIGFGKTAEQSLALIKHAHVFTQLGVKVLIGHSRKSFLSLFTAADAKNRDVETLSCSVYLAQQKIDYLRIHNVYDSAQCLKVFSSL